jgi:hypothetical protein
MDLVFLILIALSVLFAALIIVLAILTTGICIGDPPQNPKEGHQAHLGQENVARWLLLVAGLLDRQPRTANPGRHAADHDGGHGAASADQHREGHCSGEQAVTTSVFAALGGLLLGGLPPWRTSPCR